MENSFQFSYLDQLYKDAPEIKLNDRSKFVIISDLHVGKRKRRDDFLNNSDMFMHLLKNYYLKNDYKIILNGDVEELQRLPLKKIKAAWPDLFEILEECDKKGDLYKIMGNHDADLYLNEHTDINRNLLSGLRINYKGHSIFVFHGHQASLVYMAAARVSKLLLKYVAHPLGIKNFTRSHDNKKIHNTEKIVYEYSKTRKIISIIGHTHRPLFESLSEVDLLRFKIENLLRQYSGATQWRKKQISEEIKKYQNELSQIFKENHEYGFRSSLYTQEVTIPCIFNSGCVIGKRGMTAIELTEGNISLVHWFDRGKNIKNYNYREESIERLDRSSYYKMVLKTDSLKYVFTRLKLLT
jgi:UDP-2,3-diacylglucosamine pyrophosphatase LpxH